MSGARLWVETVCRNCSVTGYGRWTSGGKVSVSEFRQEAKERGWLLCKGGEFLCPECVKRATAATQPAAPDAQEVRNG